ncbi:MAG TPA: hypothetical protein VHO50_07835 [Bacteroidales bacterium]|nr:hypothetical protein [Bacteroidales bacterium]
MKKMLLGILFAVGILSFTNAQQSSQAKESDWVKIGQTTINLSEDYGVFDWDRDREESVSANDKYSAIRFKAKDGKVSLTNVEVKYDSGKQEKMNFQGTLDPNAGSKELKLDTRQDLDEVTFSFLKDETAPQDKAVIEVWGLKDKSSGMGKGTDIDVNVDVDTANRM